MPPREATGSKLSRLCRAVLIPVAIAAVGIGALRAFSVPLDRLIVGARPTLLSVSPAPKFTAVAAVGEVVTARFSLRNAGKSPVKVLGANVGCPCTSVENIFPVEIGAGAEQQITVHTTVNSPDETGRFTQAVPLLLDREGTVPPLVVEVAVRSSP